MIGWIFGFMMRRSVASGDRRRGAELGPGHRGRGRHAARPCAGAQSPFRHRRRQARRAGAGAQSGRGRDHPGVGLRPVRGARDRRHDRRRSDHRASTTTACRASPTFRRSTSYFDEGGFEHVLGGSVGIGEVATVPTSAAIANAIRNAIGVRPARDPDPARPADRSSPSEDRRMTAMTPIVPAPGEAEFRASGTDLSERRRSGVSRGPLVDIAPTSGMTGIAWDAAGAARIGASTIDRRDRGRRPAGGGLSRRRRRGGRPGDAADPASRHPRRQSRPALALLVLPQSPYRLPQEGRRSTARRARATIFMASSSISGRASPRIPRPWRRRFSAYEAKVTTNQREDLSIEQLLGDGSNGAADHALEAGEMIEAVELAPPLAGERAAYKRAIGRAYAEWPLVEVVARVVIERGAFQLVRLAAGGVAPVPMRLRAAEAAAQGAPSACDHRGGGSRRDLGAKPLADDGLQARSARGSGPGPFGAVLD